MLNIYKRKSIVHFGLYPSKHPAISIKAVRYQGMYTATGYILLHWIFVGIERIRPDSIAIVWNWGLKPISGCLSNPPKRP